MSKLTTTQEDTLIALSCRCSVAEERLTTVLETLKETDRNSEAQHKLIEKLKTELTGANAEIDRLSRNSRVLADKLSREEDRSNELSRIALKEQKRNS